MTYTLCIDPGVTGAYALFDSKESTFEKLYSFKDILSSHIKLHGLNIDHVVIEQVHASPQMGPSSAFTFGKNYGEWLGLIVPLDIPITYHPPQKWQKPFNLQSQGDARKSELWCKAQDLYPTTKILKKNADAILLGYSHFNYLTV